MSGLHVSLQAIVDLEEIWLYIARDNLKAASKLRRDIESRFEMLARQPLLGESREDLAPGLGSSPFVSA